MMRGLAAFLGACALLAATACVDFEGTVNPSFGLPDSVVAAPTLARDVQPIFDRRCAYGGCHSAATRQAGLSLVAGASWASLVGRPARRAGDTLVVAGAAARSWLMRMIEDDATARAGRSRMPLAAAPLTANQIETIARWIDRGAPPE